MLALCAVCFTPEISRRSLWRYWAISSVFNIALRAMFLFELISACITFSNLTRPAMFSLLSLDCSRSWSCLVNKYCYEIVRSLNFLSNTNIAWRGWASILSSTTLQFDKICHDVSLIFTCKKHKHRRYTIQFDQRQNNFSQRQKYKCGWRSSWKHVLPPCF